MAAPFGPDDEDAYEAMRTELVERFEASPEGAGRGWVADQILELKWSYLDGDVGSWGDQDVGEILLELYPRKVITDRDDLGTVIDGFAAFFDFLGGEGILAPQRAHSLAATVRRARTAFFAAMSDERRFGMGKRLFAAMTADGVDPADRSGVESWMASFNERPLTERDRVLGPMAAAAGIARGALGRMPPVVLPPLEELEGAAAGSVMLGRVRAFVDFVSEGRRLTDRGNLTVADGRRLVEVLDTDDSVEEHFGDRVFKVRSSAELLGVDLTFQVAHCGGFVEVTGRKVHPGPHAPALADDPLEALYYLFLSLVHRVGPSRHRLARAYAGFSWFDEELDRRLVPILIDLYRHPEPVPVDDVAEETWEELLGLFDLEDEDPEKLGLHRILVGNALRQALHRLEELGVVVVAGTRRKPIGYETLEEAGTVAITPLGSWVMQRLLSKMTDAPVAGLLADLDAASLLAHLADLPEDVASAELHAWIDRHGDAAADLMVDALVDAPETARALALRALLKMGPAAAAAVDRLAAVAELAGWVTVWRVDAQVASAEELQVGDDPERYVRVVYAALCMWGPQAAATWATSAAAPLTAATALEATWRVRIPETETVLALVGQLHPDKAVAKAARKALFRHRSSAGSA